MATSQQLPRPRPASDVALSSLSTVYERLASAVLAAARARGHDVADPFAAAEALLGSDPAIDGLSRAASDLWLGFFGCFRSDEAAHELAAFRKAADQVNRRLAKTPAGQPPDPELALEILRTLETWWQQRHEAISARLDSLIADLSKVQARLGAAEMGAAFGEDEQGRMLSVLEQALTQQGITVGNDPPAVKLGRLLERFRRQAVDDADARRGTVQAFSAFLAAVRAAARGQLPPALPNEANALVDEIHRLAVARRELDAELAKLRAAVAEQERLDQAASVAAAAVAPAVDTDERLALYRAAFQAIEEGRDAGEWFAKIRHVERVCRLNRSDAEQLVRVLDRHLDQLSRLLGELRAVVPELGDPRRFRPKIFGSAYDLRTPGGQLLAWRDAAADLAIATGHARTAVGCAVLAEQVPNLQLLFRELVRLVAAWRKKLGDPPPISITISLDAGSVLSLPGIVANDLQSIVKRRSKAAEACEELLPVIERSVALYHRVVMKATGEKLPRVPPAKRTSPAVVVGRLAEELAALAARLEADYGQLAADGFRSTESGKRLRADPHLLTTACQQLDAACTALAAIDGAPDAPSAVATAPDAAPACPVLPPWPAGDDPAGTARATAVRSTWLATYATYRFHVTG